MRMLSDSIHTARVDYRCDASRQFLDIHFGRDEVNPEDWEIVRQAEADGFKIKAGTKYRKVVYAHYGSLETFKARLDMDGVCIRTHSYDEE